MLLIHGPPGTGKTLIIGKIVSDWLNQPDLHNILLCAPSNAAADKIAEALCEYPNLNRKFVRIVSEKKEDIFNVDFKTLKNYDLLHKVLTFDGKTNQMI